jgi:hypothetical protein
VWDSVVDWWKSLWIEQKVPAAALAGFIAAFVLFLIKDALWQSRVVRVQKRSEFQQKQLDFFYAPVYRLYCQAYVRFQVWQQENPDTKLSPQPFFEPNDDESFVEKLFAEHPSYASPEVLRLWAAFRAVDGGAEKNDRRRAMISVLIKEYNLLRKELRLEYDKSELKTGEFTKLAS